MARVIRVDRDIYRPGPRADIRLLVARAGKDVPTSRLRDLGLLDDNGKLLPDVDGVIQPRSVAAEAGTSGIVKREPAAPKPQPAPATKAAVSTITRADAPSVKVGTAEPARPSDAEALDGIRHVGGGWYELPNGERVQGEDAAREWLRQAQAGE